MQMYKIGWFVLTLCFGFAACAVDVPPQEVAAVGVNESALTEDGCASPRPPMRGCRIPCKPCLIPECVDGQWTFERVELGLRRCRELSSRVSALDGADPSGLSLCPTRPQTTDGNCPEAVA